MERMLEMENRPALLRRLRAFTALLLVVLYIAGLVAMFASSVQLGLILWVISTLGGGGMLYWLHTREKKGEEAARGEDTQGGGEGPCA